MVFVPPEWERNGNRSRTHCSEAAKSFGALTVGVVTLPFSFEGKRRMETARQGIEALRDNVDTLITIKNDSLFKIIKENASTIVAFRIVDDVLYNAVKGISDLINTAGTCPMLTLPTYDQ